MRTTFPALLVLTTALAACDRSPDSAVAALPSRPPAPAVDAARLVAADSEPDQWLSTGRTYDEQRFSPLIEIDASNVGELGLAWYGDFAVARAQEATPLFVDGVLYVTTAWSNVKAYDARTGAALWTYDAKVPRTWGSRA